MSIGQRIKDRRLELGLTQKQLGELCGMADSAVRKYESGKIIPKKATIERISHALSISEADLYDEETRERNDRIQYLNEVLSASIVGSPTDKAEFIRAVSDLPDDVFTAMMKKWIDEANEMKAKLNEENK